MKNNFKIVEKLQKTRKYTKKSIVKKLEKDRSRKKSLLFAKKWYDSAMEKERT